MEPQHTNYSQPQLQPQKPQEQQHHQDQQPARNHQFPHLHPLVTPSYFSTPLAQTAASAPVSSPGLSSPTIPRPISGFPVHPASESNTPAVESSSPYLHPLQNRKVRETHKALIDSDSITGRKLINQYEVIEEIGRGMHGKVKLARNLESGENVAIKIIPRYSKRRRLGKVMAMSPQDKTMREIAILKKMRHPNVVSLLEIIDDPELRKIYLILEHVELGEVVWRKKGLPHICAYERRRIEREMRDEPPSTEEEQYDLLLERRQAIKELKRAKMSLAHEGTHDYWSMEHGVEDHSNPSQSRTASGDDLAAADRRSQNGQGSLPGSDQPSRDSSRAPSRSQSNKSLSRLSISAVDGDSLPDQSDVETPGPTRSSNPGSTSALDGTMYGPYVEEGTFRGRSPSMADSIISHMSSVDWNPRTHDPFAEDFSYVPCFTLEQARSVFRDTVLGLEYLHYQGVVHRDIKPANLLWTKDHRVKISDFGVSYFGRPIRDGEPDDETVSESEAQDFDDDLELAKTVGTPAFFAPELCYTDTEREQLPKISEMIDIWSLGVTLYCLIYARIPFQAEDEWIMFKKIATEDVLIPKRRLRPVDPATQPNGSSLYKRQNNPPYRDDNSLVYEDIDQNLRDLLQLMFTKHPDQRIRLRDIKRHPWVVQGIPNPIAWIDDTDPARPSQGRRVQVDAKETAHAVVPITFLQRARSTVKKAVGKLIHPLVSERSDSGSRRRATSSVASSAGDSSMQPVAPSVQARDLRRKSLKGDDYVSNVKDFAGGISEHPLSQSMNTSPTDPCDTYDPLATTVAQPSRRQSQDAATEFFPEFQDHSQPFRRPSQRFLALTEEPAPPPGSKTSPTTPFSPRHFEDSNDDPERSRKCSQHEDASRSQSVDRALFVSADKRAPAKVGISAAVAPGTLHRVPSRPRPARSIDLGKAKKANQGVAPPLLSSSQAITGYQHGQPQSDSNIYENRKTSNDLGERPQTAHKIETARSVPDARTPPTRTYKSTAESFAKAKENMQRKRVEQYHHQLAQQAAASRVLADVGPANVPCPPSPDDEEAPRASRGSTMETAKSSRSTSMAGITTPLTSPSEVASPISCSAFPSNEQMLPFRSDPSLPALSGASSVSADVEAELPLELAAVSARPELLETTDSLTPPAMTKEPISGFPLEQMEQQQAAMEGVIAVKLDQSDKAPTSAASSTPDLQAVDEEQQCDDDDSDSDEGLVMARSTKKKRPPSAGVDRTPFGVTRRDTNASMASTDTAKRIYDTHSNEMTSPRPE